MDKTPVPIGLLAPVSVFLGIVFVLVVAILWYRRQQNLAKNKDKKSTVHLLPTDIPPPEHCWRDGRCGYCDLLERIEKQEAERLNKS